MTEAALFAVGGGEDQTVAGDSGMADNGTNGGRQVTETKHVNLKAIKLLVERCWTAASKLESQVVRTANLPSVYRQHVSEAFESLRELNNAVAGLKGPWRVSGETEDGRMITIANAEGSEVAHVHDFETAKLLVALSQLG